MKDQYFGDINDYRKYALLRTLCEDDTTVAMCWMLTPDDSRRDGRKTAYLEEPNRWRHYDPTLFDSLKQAQGTRNVRQAEISGIFPNAVFHPALLGDSPPERCQHFQEFFSLALDRDLIFFDPDNGLEVPSKPCGRKRSSKYGFWKEVEQAWASRSSILIYQHFPRKERSGFISQKAEELRKRLGTPKVVSFRTPHVAFFLANQPKHEFLLGRAREIKQVWEDQIQVQFHPPLPEQTETGQ